MQTYKKTLILSLVLAAFFALAGTVGAAMYYTLSLSQTNVSLSVGQTTTVTAYNNNYSYNYGTLYIYNNSNSNIATAYISGNSVSIYGNSTGSSNITVCQRDNTYYNSYDNNNCGIIYVNVGGGSYYQTNNSGLNLSSLTLPIGGSATVASAVNYSGMYVSNNSNPSVATATNSSIIPGCTGNSLYSITTGQLCTNNQIYNGYNQYYTSYIPGCMAGYTYSITTGQLCNNNYNGYNNNYSYGNSSIQILAVSAGSTTVTLCQNNGSAYYGNACSIVYVTVY